jgi:hypothetical protein
MSPTRSRTPLRFAALLLGALLVGCAGRGGAGEPGHPVLVAAWTPNAQVREGVEWQLERDLRALGITATPSLRLIPEFDDLRRRTLLDAAAERSAPVILMIRRLAAGDDASAPSLHLWLSDYFAGVDRDRSPEIPPPGRQVVEVAAYRVEGEDARLVWSGHSWVDFDGDLEAAIRDTAEIISINMATARARVRAGEVEPEQAP